MTDSTNHGLMHRIGTMAEDDPQAVAVGQRLLAVRHAAQAVTDVVADDELPANARAAMAALRAVLAPPWAAG